MDKKGRPPIYKERMQQIGIHLRQDQILFLRTKPNISEFLRAVIDQAMERERRRG